MSETRGGSGKVVRPDEGVKFDAGSCEALGKASMKCLEEIGYDRNLAQTVCKPQYDAYRECRKQQQEAKKAANKAAQGKWALW